MSEKMFASFRASPERRPEIEFKIRLAVASDIEGLAQLAAQRDSGDVVRHRERMADRVAQDKAVGSLFIAESKSGQLLAFGAIEKLAFAEAGASESDGPALVPDGWYLTGVVVTPSARRAGIATALTLARVANHSAVSPLRFVVNANNRASIALHDALGFEFESQDFTMPGVTFTGGKGHLFRLGSEATTP